MSKRSPCRFVVPRIVSLPSLCAFLYLAVVGFFSTPVFAAPSLDRLFLSPQEMTSSSQSSSSIETDPTRIRLDALIYYAPDQWTLWLQGKEWTPRTHDPNLTIISVTPQNATLRWRKPPFGQSVTFTLSPHAIFDGATNTIVPLSFSWSEQ